MDYAIKFDEYIGTLSEIVYTGSNPLDELRDMIEAIVAVMDLTSSKGRQFDKSLAHHKEQFNIDLRLLNKVIVRKSDQEREAGFYEVKIKLKRDLMDAASKFRFISD